MRVRVVADATDDNARERIQETPGFHLEAEHALLLGEFVPEFGILHDGVRGCNQPIVNRNVLLVFIPYLTALIYLIVYGSDMRERSLRAEAEAKHAADDYIRAAAHTSPADELHKLHDLVQKGALTEAEYDRAKQKLLASA